MFRAAALPALVVGTVLAILPAAQAQNSFEVPRDEILAKVHRVGLMPMTLAEDFKDRSEVKTRYEELLTERLRKLGWEIVPSAKYDELLLQLKREIGGFHDPFTGVVDVEKRKAVNEHAQREFHRLHQLDATLSPGIRRVSAYWSHNFAFSHGVEESSTGKEGFQAAMNSPSATGTIPALSLALGLFGADDKMMYGRFGGIQLASYVGQGGVGGFVDIPPDLLLRDPVRDARAAALALEPLLKSPEQIRAEVEDERLASTRQHVLSVLDAERHVDAILTPAVVPRPADFRGGDATWDGVKRNAAGLKGLAAFFGSTGEFGRVPALSLEVTLVDRDGAELYRDLGGIHLLRKQDKGRLVDLEETELFQDPARDERAVHVALRALLLIPEALYIDIHGRKPER